MNVSVGEAMNAADDVIGAVFTDPCKSWMQSAVSEHLIRYLTSSLTIRNREITSRDITTESATFPG